MSALIVRGLTKSYRKGFIPKKIEVLKGVDFQIPAGKITGFLGANGAGKTTTMKCLLGLTFPDSGQIQFFGQESVNKEVKRRVGFLPERPYFYEYLTGNEFLRFYGQLSTSLSSKALNSRIDDLLRQVDLSHAKHKKLREYSKGMLQRVGVAQALIHNPEFVILDEPMGGLDPDGRHDLSEIIKETASRGTTVFFSSHLLNDAEKLCEYLVIMKAGVVIYQGTTLDLLSQVASHYEVVFSTPQGPQSLRVPDLSGVQSELDRLRSLGAAVLEVKPVRQGLEEIFIKMALERGLPR